MPVRKAFGWKAGGRLRRPKKGSSYPIELYLIPQVSVFANTKLNMEDRLQNLLSAIWNTVGDIIS